MPNSRSAIAGPGTPCRYPLFNKKKTEAKGGEIPRRASISNLLRSPSPPMNGAMRGSSECGSLSLPHRLTNPDTSNLITRPSSALTGTRAGYFRLPLSLTHCLTHSHSLVLPPPSLSGCPRSFGKKTLIFLLFLSQLILPPLTLSKSDYPLSFMNSHIGDTFWYYFYVFLLWAP